MSTPAIFDLSSKDRKARISGLVWIFRHLTKHKIKFAVMTIGILITIFLRMIFPLIIGIMIDISIIPQDLEFLFFFTSLLLGIGLFRVGINYLTLYATNLLAWQAIRDIRIEFFENMQKKPLKFHDKMKSGDLMALATNDMTQLAFMINPGVRLVADAFVSVIIVLFLVFTISTIFTVVLLPLFFIYIWTIKNYNSKIRPISATFLHKWSLISRTAQDSITGIKVVRAFNGEEFESIKFRKVVENFKSTWKTRQMIVAKFWPLFVINLTIGLSFIAGSWFVLQNQLTFGELVAINGMLVLLIQPTMIIEFAVMIFQEGLAGGERIFHIMMAEEAEESNISEQLAWPAKIEGRISFKNVNFKYDGTSKYVLTNINLEINPGETIALVGPTGAGKTTLTQLLLRFYDFEGSISIDGIDIRNYSLRDLRQNLGRVEQDIFLFATSIKDNLTFGIGKDKYITNEIIFQATQTAQAHNFIIEQKDGYDTIIGERGAGLSGGQRQRIAIARCLLTDPPILILDDSTSAIDSETEEKISKAMQMVMKNRTTFLITHRLSAIRKADKIIVLKEGTIKAIGKHYDLLQSSKDYRRIFSKTIPALQGGNK